MRRHGTIEKAYKSSRNFYDDVLTRRNWLSKLYIDFFWDVDDNLYAAKIMDFIPENFSGKLLDVPVGTAVFTWEKYGRLPGSDITCLDYSPEMLTKAQARFEEAGIGNVRCLRGDVGNLPFEDASFDILLSMNGFHVFPEKEKAFSETARVLKPGGIFIGCFYIRREKKLTDFIVGTVLEKKGWFTPPYQNRDELAGILASHYTHVELNNEHALAWFRCVK